MKKKSAYGEMGVDTQKGAIGKKFSDIIANDFPYAFCNIVIEPDTGLAKTSKFDGTGSKPTQRCLVYLETGDPRIFEGDAEDCYVMIAGDASMSGLVWEHTLGDIIDINKFNVPKAQVVDAISKGFKRVVGLHQEYGFNVQFLGGETADLASQTSSYILNGLMTARGKASEVIDGITMSGDQIWGLSSTGQSIWEYAPNSGLMCNGVTAACGVTMWEGYNEKYPWLRHEKQKYRGRFKVGEKVDGLEMPVSDALLSPTRQWAIVIRMLIEELKENKALPFLHGITMNTGGGATKCLRLGDKIRYIKNMPKPPALFQLIKQEGNISWEEMFEDFNCGVGVDIIGSGEGGHLNSAIKTVAEKVGIDAFLLGVCVKASGEKNEVILETPYGIFNDYGN